MFDPKGYREDCARLALGQEKIEEMIRMTENENKKSFRRPLRVALIAAAAVALLTVTAFAAVPAVQKLIVSFNQYTITAKDGAQMDVSAITIPNMALEDWEGRRIFTLDDQEYDITDALERDGKYVVETDEVTLTVTPDGTATLVFRDTGESFVLDLYAEGMGVTNSEEWQMAKPTPGAHPENWDAAQTFQYTENDDGSITVTDGEGNVTGTIE